MVDPKLWPTKTKEGDRDWYVEARVGSENYRGHYVHFIRDWHTDEGRQYVNAKAEDVIAQLLEERDAAIRERDEARGCNPDAWTHVRASEAAAVSRECEMKERAEKAEAEAERLRHEKDDAELYAERLQTLLTAARSIRDRALDERDRWKALLAECVALLEHSRRVAQYADYQAASKLANDIDALLAKLRKVTP